jgi:hypothetical protein
VINNSAGFLYLRHQKGVGYCFGRCKDLAQRNKGYRKPNPLIVVPLDSFATRDSIAAERELIYRLEKFMLYEKTSEWAKETSEVLEVWESVKARHCWRPNKDGKFFPFVRQLPLFS